MYNGSAVCDHAAFLNFIIKVDLDRFGLFVPEVFNHVGKIGAQYLGRVP